MPDLRIAVLVPDGAADLPISELGEKTPLEYSSTPFLDRVAGSGCTGTLRTVPRGMKPGSDVANLSLLGYDPGASYCGRGPIEAASLGIEIPEGWAAFRCNLVHVDDGVMSDYSAGHISSESGRELISLLDDELGDAGTRFFPGKSYRNILLAEGVYDDVECAPPHDIMGLPFGDYLPSGEGSERLRRLISKSRELLECAEINRTLAERGETTGNMIWPWGAGTGISLEPFRERFGYRGGIISAVDLICGLGRLVGLIPAEVEGITGFLDTDYRAKGEEAVRILEKAGFVYVHVEATDEASHMGDYEEKVKAVESFDSDVAGPVLEYLVSQEKPWRLMVAPDHPTFISTRTHAAEPVPCSVCGEGVPTDETKAFSETESMRGFHLDSGWRMMFYLTGMEPWPW